MADTFGTRTPGETTGGSVSDVRPTTGDIRLVMQTIGEIGAKMDRLITDRKDDKDEIARKVDEARGDLKSRIDEKHGALTKQVDDLKTEFKEFRKEDFKPLQTDVSNLRMKWAWMAGVGAVVGILISLAVELIKSHIH